MPADTSQKKSLKDLIVDAQLLDPKKAEAEAGRCGNNTVLFLLRLILKNLVEREKLLDVIAQGWDIKAVDLSTLEIDPDVIKLVPDTMQKRYNLLPFAKEEGILSIALSDPRNIFFAEDIELRTGLKVRPYFAFPDDIVAAAQKAGFSRSAGLSKVDLAGEEEEEAQKEAEEKEKKEGAAEEMPAGEAATEALEKALEAVRDQSKEMAALGEEVEVGAAAAKADVTEVNSNAPEVEKLMNIIILAAIREKASDIHIEPFEDPKGKKSKMGVRLRVDGLLRDAKYIKVPWAFRNAIIAKLKIMTRSMNITERRIPQSGRIQVMAKGNPVEFRVEIVPTAHGESCVMRVLDRRSVQVDIHNMGFLPDTLENFLSLLKGIGGKKNFGLILVVGPTGSGKSTTLYGALNHVNRPDIKILTAENPVEYNLDGIIQVPVNPDLKLSGDKVFDFSSALRSFLRLDPDVIMVGEIRDRETAQIGMEAAMTGHLVFSTLHTNDAPSSIARLVEMKIPSYLVASTMKAILAQRLSRRLCPDCKRQADPTPDEIAIYNEHKIPLPAGAKIYQTGETDCPTCGGSGYKGRCPIHELMIMTDELRALCLKEVAAEPLKQMAMSCGMRTLVQDGLTKVLQGMTTVREVLGGASETAKEEEKKEEPAVPPAAPAQAGSEKG
ncbi:MAG: Flp pilus assembly complex ATPase component TadA [Elusimicrobia bacterium]|nr:Flp pilus assembly complex ATPase component TadA [Elusimicrobiota bacterium]